MTGIRHPGEPDRPAQWLAAARRGALALALALSVPAAMAMDLVDVYRLATVQDPQIREAEALRAADVEFRSQSRALLLPFVTADAEYDRVREEIISSPIPGVGGRTDRYGILSLSLSLAQPIYRREYFAQLRQADAVIGRADAQYSAAHQALIVRSAQVYFDLLAASDDLRFAQSEKDAIGRQLEQARQRFEVGLIAITDVHVAQAAYDAATAREIEAMNAVQSAQEALYELTGEFIAEVDRLAQEVPLTNPEPAEVDAWVETAMEQNFTLLAARFNTEFAEEAVEVQRSGHYPTLDLVANMARVDPDSGAAQSEVERGSIGLRLALPLYQGGAVRSRSRQAGYELVAAREQLESAQRATRRQARDAYNAVIAAIRRVEALAQARVSARSALDATEAGMEVGTRTAVDVLLARTELFAAESDFARARYDYLLNTLVLKQAAGTLSIADLEEINRWLEQR